MVVVLKTPNPLLQNFFHYDVDLLVVSWDYVPWSGLLVVEPDYLPDLEVFYF
jgi:hypothetical protein